LTFDLCERPDEITGYQGEIVDYLRAQKIRATFFVGGKWMASHPERAQQLMSDPLFEVGNHTWGHHNLRLLRGPRLFAEIRNAGLAYGRLRDELDKRQCVRTDAQKLAHELAPKTLKLFRFPYGACDAESLKAVADLGMLSIQWDVSSGDAWLGQSAEMIKQDVVTRVRPGSIVLFHANGRGWNTGSALPRIIKILRDERKYEFVTVSELLAAGKWEIASECFDSRPRERLR
jgi:peptidoglycan/xylan/chitin deacetylase (PgdA/CDA1 family)